MPSVPRRATNSNIKGSPHLEQGEALGVRGHVRLHRAERGGQALAPCGLLLHEGREVGQVRAGRGAGVRGERW